jgi:hypothetical protein
LPREVRGDAAPVHHRPRHAEAGRRDAGGWTIAQEAADDGLEAPELGAGQDGFPRQIETGWPFREKGDRRLGSADVAREQYAAT